MRNSCRRVAEDIVVLSALAFLSASHFDKTEIQLVTAFGAYLAGRAITEELPRKKLGYSWPEIAAACVLACCLTVKCGHDVIARYWATVAVVGDVSELENHLAGIGQ